MKWLTQYDALEAAATAGPWTDGNAKKLFEDVATMPFVAYTWSQEANSGIFGKSGNASKKKAAANQAMIIFLRNTAPKLARLKAAVDALHHEFTEAGIRELRAARAELDGEGE